jgi:hypothetical protein
MKKACFSASKARCWSFTCMLVQKLPRELRDAIYEQFLEPNHRQAVLCSRHFDEWQVYEGHPERWDEPIFQGAYPPYFAYPYCVHETFALEVSEALYRVCLVQVKEVTLLAQFLRRDVFGTDCIPGDNIRCLRLKAVVVIRRSSSATNCTLTSLPRSSSSSASKVSVFDSSSTALAAAHHRTLS